VDLVLIAIVLDELNRRVVGWAIGKQVAANSLALAALYMAIAGPSPRYRAQCTGNSRK